MPIEVRLNALPESVEEATLMRWYKKEGDAVKRDEKIADIETDKVVLEIAAPENGVLVNINKKFGDTLVEGELLGTIDETASAPANQETQKTEEPEELADSKAEDEHKTSSSRTVQAPAEAASSKEAAILSPAAKKLAEEYNLTPSAIEGTGRDGRITKADVARHLDRPAKPSTKETSQTEPTSSPLTDDRHEERVPMSRLRVRIAERLVEAQQTAAILTTFNEVNMQSVMDLRKRYRESFEKEHGVKLGFMSFFAKASVEALKKFPAVNAFLDGKDIIYHGYYDMGIAVSSPRGLVVPVLRNVDRLTFAEIEAGIADFAQRAREGQLTMDDLTGGTFTLTNGGIFGSLLSTPILNPPQSGILGMHKIQPRPVAEEGQVIIRPMMYLALSYDHRMVDGREAVSFLVAIKDLLEDPSRLLLNV